MTGLVFSPAAVSDLDEIHEYIAKDSLSEALKFIERLQERCERLAEFPGTGTMRDELWPGMRSAAEGRYLNLCTDAGIEIVRVIEGHRNLRKVFRVK